MINISEHNKKIYERLYKENDIVKIDSNKIFLKDGIHFQGIHNPYIRKREDFIIKKNKDNKEENNKVIIVSKNNGKYYLVSGLVWYLVNQKLGRPSNCIILDFPDIDNFKFNKMFGIIATKLKVSKLTEEYVFFSKIRVPKNIKYSKPNQLKIKTKFEEFKKNNGLLKPVSVKLLPNGRYQLVDGYISFLYLEKMVEPWIPIKIIK